MADVLLRSLGPDLVSCGSNLAASGNYLLGGGVENPGANPFFLNTLEHRQIIPTQTIVFFQRVTTAANGMKVC